MKVQADEHATPVCPCCSLYRDDIADAVQAGATTFKAVFDHHACTRGCGGCVQDVMDFIHQNSTATESSLCPNPSR